MDMCSINPAYLGKEYRYAYGCSARRPCNYLNALAKIDLVKKTVKNWHEEDGTAPSEPLFVARPGATSEDDGQFIWTHYVREFALFLYIYSVCMYYIRCFRL